MLSGQSFNSGSGTDLGGRVRSLRRERGLTLKALGRLAGLSHPFLSQVERGLASPSLSSLERIAEALDVPVAHLWTPPPPREERLLRRDREATGVRELLAGAPAVDEWSSESRGWAAVAGTSAGEVLVYVARGALDVELGDTVHELAEGDAVVFDGTTACRLRRRGAPSTRALIVRA